ncbi:hypothetical protein TNCV_2909041 [Trichonephila clavipes]|nr:hypothetical protein TNCV_2909041 [Trichonephila clavipes]
MCGTDFGKFVMKLRCQLLSEVVVEEDWNSYLGVSDVQPVSVKYRSYLEVFARLRTCLFSDCISSNRQTNPDPETHIL